MLVGVSIVSLLFYIVYRQQLCVLLPQLVTSRHTWYATVAITSLLCIVLGTRRVLKWPIFLLFISFVLVELILYVLLRYFIRLLESIFIRPPVLNDAENYDDWRKYAFETDKLCGREAWKTSSDSKYYNDHLTRALTNELKACRESGDVEKSVKLLQMCINKSMNGVLNEHLYSKSLVGTKYVIEEYIAEIVTSLQHVTAHAQSLHPDGQHIATVDETHPNALEQMSDADFQIIDIATDTGRRSPTTLTSECILQSLKAMKSHYGSTALCLSGGAGLGHFHWGVVQALLSSGYLPRIISGTSSGAIVAAVVCTRSDDELRSTLNADVLLTRFNCFDVSWMDRIKRYVKHRAMFDRDRWLEKLQWFAGADGPGKIGLTFKEAHEKTGRILNITATNARKHSPPLCLNYLSTPNVTIASAVLASAAVPGLIHPVPLIEKVVDREGRISYRPLHSERLLFRDGSFENDIPLNTLSEAFGCSYFLVSQTNPHIIPFFFNARGQGGVPSGWRLRGGGYRGGFVLAAVELLLKEDMKKYLRVMGMLDLLPAILEQDWSFLFLQEFQGQITMVPHARLTDYLRLISDIKDVNVVARFLQEGKLTAWRKFSMIKNREQIRQTLEDCIHKLDNRM